ncbi:DgyrCDS14126 [Dimorphilus gyrociliatus]|uniref:Glycosyltransferase family 92 protein n=1 Tax=Dimorphilus gyrociliatus TaxID=2664684 RepID=A0A7I8WCR8_9ANNE|nr:DgyrCDS14126 [Dimorphilus gyrociliatus]
MFPWLTKGKSRMLLIAPIIFLTIYFLSLRSGVYEMLRQMERPTFSLGKIGIFTLLENNKVPENNWSILRIKDNIEIWALSAIVQDSETSHTIGYKHPALVIFFVANTRYLDKKANLICDIIAFNGSIKSRRAKVNTLKKSYRYKETGLQDYFITCPLYKDDTKLRKVGLRWRKASIQLDVLYPYSKPSNLTICVPILYGYFEKNMLIEWFEYYKWLGVESIHVYPWRVSKTVMDVLRFFENKGMVVVKSIKNPVEINYKWKESMLFTNKKPMMIKAIMPPILNECFLMNSKRSRYVLSIDFDEVLMVRQKERLFTLIERYQKQKNCHSQLTFGQYFFEVSCNKTKNHPSFLFSHVFRQKDKYFRYVAPKSIIDPRFCEYYGNHFCSRKIPAYINKKKEIFSKCLINRRDGFIAHFRKKSTCFRRTVNEYTEEKSLEKLKRDLEPIFKSAKQNFAKFLQKITI